MRHRRRHAPKVAVGDVVRFRIRDSQPEVEARVIRLYVINGARRAQTVDARGLERCIGLSRCRIVSGHSAARLPVVFVGTGRAAAVLSLPA